ncbi:hypothetical protein [Planktotalea sp.]|uniref:hypothetical protein n=1 Tax=Planktotalea sp. TaxID=2029877 RepID=UPI00329A309B
MGQNNLGYPGVGAQLHKIALYANKQKNTDVLARISQTILPAFKSSALTSVPFHVNKAYVSFLCEDWDEVQNALHVLQNSDANIDNLLWDIHVKRGQLCETTGEFEQEFQYLSTLLDGPFDMPKVRTQVAKMGLSSVRYAQKLGLEVTAHSPLLTPTVLEQVSPETLRSIAPSLPKTLHDWSAMDQTPRATPSNASAADRPLRILIASNAGNWNFLREATEVLEEAGIEVRFLPFDHLKRAIDQTNKTDRTHPTMFDMLYTTGPCKPSQQDGFALLADACPWAHDLITWCDVVFVEWWNAPAVWFSRYLPEDTSLIVRCHSYEAFSVNPYFTNMARVDGAIFIADHIREVFLNSFSLPALTVENTTVIQNIRDLKQLSLDPKTDDARFTLGLMQYSNWNKDPIFALDILEQLVAQNPRWTLRLVGTPWADELSDFEAAYHDAFLAKLAPLEQHVIFDPFTRDVAGWREKIGYILSTSRREGSHESVVEAMASGVIPVLRRWPLMAQFGAPESMFPDFPAFDTAEDAAAYILAKSQQKEDAADRANIRAQTLARYDISTSGIDFVTYIRDTHSKVQIGQRHE